jgi:hypothetical protein
MENAWKSNYFQCFWVSHASSSIKEIMKTICDGSYSGVLCNCSGTRFRGGAIPVKFRASPRPPYSCLLAGFPLWLNVIEEPCNKGAGRPSKNVGFLEGQIPPDVNGVAGTAPNTRSGTITRRLTMWSNQMFRKSGNSGHRN